MKYLYPNQPIRISPMSPAFERLVADENYVAEKKINDWRCLVQKTGNLLCLWSRHKTVLNQSLRNLRAELVEQLPDETLLDGGLMNNRTTTIKEKLIVWDVLIHKGRDVTGKSLRVRRDILEEMFPENTKHIELSEWYITDKKLLYLRAIEEVGVEGIVLKQLDSPYLWSERKCRETPYWIKIKKTEDHMKVR